MASPEMGHYREHRRGDEDKDRDSTYGD
jgi:hypothetical protein